MIAPVKTRGELSDRYGQSLLWSTLRFPPKNRWVNVAASSVQVRCILQKGRALLALGKG